MWAIKVKFLFSLSILLGLIGCGSTYNATPNSNIGVSSSISSGYGVVQSIELVSRQSTNEIGAGTVAGGVIGGVLGNQIGQGSGKTAATIAGVAGGALAGHALEKGAQSTEQGYRLGIRMDDGSVQTVTQNSNPNVRVGERVRITNGVIERV